MHLLIGGYVERQLTDRELYSMFPRLVDLLKVEAVTPLIVNKDDKGGLTAFQIIAESHISAHWLNDYCCADIFSCKDFDSIAAKEFLANELLFRDIKYCKLLQRGFE